MAFQLLTELPSSDEIKAMLPVPEEAAAVRAARVEEIRAILDGRDNRLLMLVGPCSADDEETLLEYAHRLSELQEKVRDKMLLVLRAYVAKSRTHSKGYLGMISQPDPLGEEDIARGLLASRKMQLRVLSETGLVCAAEMINPALALYADDLLGYVTVGARSVENQEHRLIASGLPMPVGFKNGTDGKLLPMLYSIDSAKLPHHVVLEQKEFVTSGNRYAHGILRGAGAESDYSANYYFDTLSEAASLVDAPILVDASHGNSARNPDAQLRVVESVLDSRKKSVAIENKVKGFMLESYILGGSQRIAAGYTKGKSITDPCLSWEKTEALLLGVAESL